MMFRSLIFILLSIAILGCADGQRRAESASTFALPDINKREWLLGKLRVIADEQALFEPGKVTKILGISFRETVDETITKCDSGQPDGFVRTTQYEPSAVTWYSPVGEGLADKSSQIVATDPRVINYKKIERRTCPSNPSNNFLERNEEAHLSFTGVSSYVCITKDTLASSFDRLGYIPTYDSDHYGEVYAAKPDDYSGTRLMFFFHLTPTDSGCAYSIIISQSQEDSLRFARARGKHQLCRVNAHKDFCESQTSPNKGRDFYSRMDDFENQACGTLEAAFEAEPLSGEMPTYVARNSIFDLGPCPAAEGSHHN